MRGVLFTREGGIALAVDHCITWPDCPFDYSDYTQEQNDLMHRYDRLFRGQVDSPTDIHELCDHLRLCLTGNPDGDDQIPSGSRDRQITAIDPTTPEAIFEQAFIEVYGRESLECVAREYPLLDLAGRQRFLDYFIDRDCGPVAIEKNGEQYHHPQIIGRERYAAQLLKQNSAVAYGIKLFRWSLPGMQFVERFHDELRIYLGSSQHFRNARKLSISRGFRLYQHQGDALRTIAQAREEGERAALVVLPTGTGKTEILLSDLTRVLASAPPSRILIAVPTSQLKAQTLTLLEGRLSVPVGDGIQDQVVVQTYAWLARHLNELESDDFSYVAIDEAHHAVSPVMRKVIQRLDPQFLLGLTATHERLDAERLEDVFGRYDVNLTLRQAIEAKLLAPIKAFRLKSSVDLSQIRFNGKDYVNADLERRIVVDSRNELIIDLLKEHFVDSGLERKSGLVFCVSVAHAEKMAARMRDRGIEAEAVSGTDARSAAKIARHQSGEIQFLATCSLLNEGWDSPRTSVIVMARPTMSKVLYTQQLGRGTRKYPGKEALYVIDVVDNYGAQGGFRNSPWSVHALLGQSIYRPWSHITDPDAPPGEEEQILISLLEGARAIEEIDLFTFEYKYPGHLSDEQLARELFVSTQTVREWVKKGKISPAVTVPFGGRQLNYFDPTQVGDIRQRMNLKVHSEDTVHDDFFEFLAERSYTFSYKIVMLLSLLALADRHGECSLGLLVDRYVDFYRERLQAGLPVDRANCPYTLENLEERDYVTNSLLKNPFEKFERKRFLYQCKDLSRISFAGPLWEKLDKAKDFARIRAQLWDDLVSYYESLGGLGQTEHWREIWQIPGAEVSPILRLLESPPVEQRYRKFLPFFDLEAAAGRFGLEQPVVEGYTGWLPVAEARYSPDSFVLKIRGRSMEPRIPDGSLALFRGGNALAGSREGRIVLVQSGGQLDPDSGYSMTVKRYHNEKVWDADGQIESARLELQSLNPDYPPIVIENPDEFEMRILGVFVETVRPEDSL